MAKKKKPSASPEAPKVEKEPKGYKALTNISHDKKKYAPGDMLPALSKEAAARLLEVKAIEPVFE